MMVPGLEQMGTEKQRIAIAILRHYIHFTYLCQRMENLEAYGRKRFRDTDFVMPGCAVLYSIWK